MLPRFAFLAAAAFALAGCIADPYPNQGDLFLSPNASIGANDAPRGSEAFCQNYARQTRDNYYESNRDSDSGFGTNGFIRSQGRAAGARAYERCLAGRTG